jgi:hypothetical protein
MRTNCLPTTPPRRTSPATTRCLIYSPPWSSKKEDPEEEHDEDDTDANADDDSDDSDSDFDSPPPK